MIIAGLILHYIIAIGFTTFCFLLFPKVKALSKNKILTGTLYGIFVWMIMNLVVVPLSSIGRPPFVFDSVLVNVLILIVCIGIPLSFMANKFYKSKSPDRGKRFLSNLYNKKRLE